MEGSFDLVAFDIFDVWKKVTKSNSDLQCWKIKNITLIQESYNTTPEQFSQYRQKYGKKPESLQD